MRGVDARNTGVYRRGGGHASVHASRLPARLNLRVEPNPVPSHARFELDPRDPSSPLEIFDPQGRLVGILPAGHQHEIVWRPQSNDLPGIYLARRQGAGASGAIRFVVLR